MNASSRQKVAATAFIASIAVYLVAAALALVTDLPRLSRFVRLPAGIVAFAAVVVLLADHRVWAIARNTIAQAIRVRVAFVIMVVYLILVPSLPFLVEGDGTPRGLLHVVLTYSLIAAGALLGALTVAVATTTLWTEVRDKQIFLLEARPIRRYQVLLGKLLGILLINAALLAFMGVVTWASARYLLARAERAVRQIPDTQQTEKRRAQRRLRDAREQVLTARRALRPDPPPRKDIEEFIKANLDQRVQQLSRSDRMPDFIRREPDPEARKALIRRQATRQLVEEFHNLVNAVPPLYARRWTFSRITARRSHDLNLTIRFKYFSSDRKSEDPDHVRWIIGAPRRDIPPEQRHQVYSIYDTYMPDEVHEIQVPTDAIDRNGRLVVQFFNLEPRRPTLIFSEADSIQVLVPVGGFTGNLARGLLVILVEVMFIAVLGLFCSTFLGFPVSPIVALSLLLLTFLSSSLKTEFETGGFTFDQNKESAVLQVAEKATRLLVTVLNAVLPPLDAYSPSSLVSAGEEVSVGMLLEATWTIALLYGGVLMLLGALLFERKEMALATP